MTAAVLDHPVTATTLVDRRPPLTRLVGLEIRKILSTRSGLALAGTAAVAPAAVTALMLALADPPPGSATLLALLGALVALLMVAIGVLSTAGEWTHGTVQTTFLAVPRRSRVLAAKYAGTALLGAVVATVVVASTLAVAALGTGPGFSWAGTGVAIAATIGAGAALTVVGAGIGAAVGNAPAALTGTYLVLLVAINILNGAKPVWGKHVDPLSAVFDLVEGDAAVRPIAVLTGWVLATAVAGVLVTRRRAVS
ncbi:MAG TPA: hypothetical protein VI357_08635 [Mycobacteriales bacterium]